MSKLQRFSICSAVLLVILLSAGSLSAQIITGEITGTVTDQSGAIVAGASVSAVCPDTNFTRTVTSGAAGEYRLSEMPACVYKVSVSTQGFKTTVRNVTVTVGQETKADFRLQLGERSDTVTVEAASPLVDYSPGVSNEVDTKAILDLPTEGRDFKSILGLTPGVQRSPGGGFMDVSINGQRTSTNNYMIDGVPNNDRFYGNELVGQPGLLGVPSALLGNDSISEYTIQQLPTAENGVKGGAAINVTLKSGTNGFHGTAFYFGDYDWLNANNFFSSTRTSYHNHNYGGTLSGPIIKDRTFFFVNFEAQRNKSLAPYNVILPTTGDLQAVQNLFNCTPTNTASCQIDPTLGTPIVTNTNNLPMNSAGLALLKYYPCSDGAGGTVQCNMSAASSTVQPGGFTQTVLLPDINTLPGSFIVKIDHKLSNKMSLSGRYLYADSVQSGPAFGYTIPPAKGSGLGADGFNSIVPTRVQFAGGNFIYNIAANKILDVRFSWSRFSQILAPNNKVDPKSLGVDTGPLSPLDFGVPPVYASSVTYGNIGGIQGYPLSTRPTQTYDITAHTTWIKGTHTFKFGGNYQRASTGSLRNRARTGLFSFQGDSQFTFATPPPPTPPPPPVAIPGYDVVLAQLLLGRMDRAARSFGDTTRNIYQPSLGLFFQDEWKMTPRVTVSYGLRWDLNGALGETGNRGSNFFPNQGLVQLGKGISRLYNLDMHDFGPRAGLAWDIFGNGKTSFRVGYSMAYDVANFAAILAPYLYQGARAGAFTNSDLGVFSVTADGNVDVGTNLATLFEAFGPNTCYNPATNTSSPDWVCIGPQPGSPNPNMPFQTYGANPTGTPPFSVFGTVSPLRTPRIQYYNATVQQELFRNNVLSVSYIGAHGTNMLLNRQLNLRPIGCWSDLINPATIDPINNPTGSPYGQLTGPPNSANNPTSLNCNRPLDTVFQTGGVPSFKYVNQLTNDGFSRYNSMQVTYRQRNWHGVNTIVNFTWSNCIDTNSVNRGGSSTLPIAENPYNPRSNQGPCDTDVRRNFNTGIGYDFPKWSAVGRLGDGWQIGSVATYASGRPWTALLSSSADNSGQDRTYQRPDCTGVKPVYQFSDPNSPTITNVPAVFAIPADGTIGTCGRNAFRGPHIVQWDFNLNKTTKITEKISFQVRFEIFNLLNHPNFNPLPAGVTISQKKIDNFPNTSFSTYAQTPDVSSGNPFLSQGGPRAGQIGAKIIF